MEWVECYFVWNEYEDNFKDGTSVKIENYNFNKFGINQTIPGYLTLGTPWVFVGGTGIGNANSYAPYGDGGSYGGLSFNYKPDAIKVKYKKQTAERLPI